MQCNRRTVDRHVDPTLVERLRTRIARCGRFDRIRLVTLTRADKRIKATPKKYVRTLAIHRLDPFGVARLWRDAGLEFHLTLCHNGEVAAAANKCIATAKAVARSRLHRRKAERVARDRPRIVSACPLLRTANSGDCAAPLARTRRHGRSGDECSASRVAQSHAAAGPANNVGEPFRAGISAR